jgi:hypothetical protein
MLFIDITQHPMQRDTVEMDVGVRKFIILSHLLQDVIFHPDLDLHAAYGA